MNRTGVWVGSLAVLGAFALAAPAEAQRGKSAASDRRVYCWEEDGHKICGDALPASAVDAARTEFSSRTGLARERVGRALSSEERAAAGQAAREAAQDAEAETVRRRRDLAMVESYATEADLERAYGDRITLIDESIKTSQMGVGNLRASLVALLRQAADMELSEQPVRKRLADDIRSQHGDLLRQQAILAQQLEERTHLDEDLRDALGRYRDFKRVD
ncbi:hypothetical protein [Luteimonas abyssi]|uniref:hypothetical protein n=1 Tax=Luteimonas abyssi TaxID=1247514 RepID=UPI000737B419|nr:hypothetical protein [Luteimonas abyssi]